jgi:hypothetical protein
MWIEKITYCYCWKNLSRCEARKRFFLKNATFCISNCVFPIVLTENAATVLSAGILNFFGIFNLLLMAYKWRQLRKFVWRPKHCIFHRVHSLYIFTLWFYYKQILGIHNNFEKYVVAHSVTVGKMFIVCWPSLATNDEQLLIKTFAWFKNLQCLSRTTTLNCCFPCVQ